MSKCTFLSSEIAHIWAHYPVTKAEQREARRRGGYVGFLGENTSTGAADSAGSAGNTSYNKGRFFSYATCIAEKVDLKGYPVYFVSSTGYSSSTSKHQYGVRAAVPIDATILPVPGDWGASHLAPQSKAEAAELFGRYIARAAELLNNSKRRRSEYLRDSDTAQSAQSIEHARTLKALYGLRHKVPESVEGAAGAVEKTRKREAAAAKRAQRKAVEDLREKAAAWREGGATYGMGRLPVMLRKRASGTSSAERIETSHGAQVPYKEARVAYKVYTTRGPEALAGLTLGSFQLISADVKSVTIGCHHISRAELDRFAKSEKWI